MTQHGQLAGCWMQQARKHLERRCLASAVRPEKANDLSAGNVERDAIYSIDSLCAAMDQALQRSPYACLALADNIGLVEVMNVDYRRILQRYSHKMTFKFS